MTGALLSVRVVHGGYLMVSLAPAALGVVAAVRGSAVDPRAQIAVGIAVTALFLWYHRITRVLTRYERARTLQVEATEVVFGMLLAALAGQWLAGIGQELAWTPGLLAGAAAVLGLLAALPMFTIIDVRLRHVARLLTDKGFVLFYLGGVHHPDPGLLTLAGWLVVVSAAQHWRGARQSRLPAWSLRDRDAHRFVNGTLAPRATAAQAWLDDKIRPGRTPDLALIHTLAQQSVMLAKGAEDLTFAQLHPGAPVPRSGRAALRRLDDAVELLELAERHHGGQPAAAARVFALARAHCAAARSEINIGMGRWEEGITATREAAALWRTCGLPDLGADALAEAAMTGLSGFIAIRAVPPGEALRDLALLAVDRELLPLVRHNVLVVASACAARLGDAARAEAWAAQAKAAPPQRGDHLRLRRQQRRAGLMPWRLRDLRLHVRLLQSARDILTLDSAPRHLEPAPSLPLPRLVGTRLWALSEARYIAERGLMWWMLGKHDRAADDLERAAAEFEVRHQPLDARWIHYTLGMALYWIDRSRAYRNLVRALYLQERVRDQTAGEDLRIDAGASIEHLTAVLIWMLVQAGGAPGDPDSVPANSGHPPSSGQPNTGLPALPLARAFELAERSRGRVMLELLGQSTALRAAPEIGELVVAEREILSDLARRRAGPLADDPRAALSAVRDARDRLTAIWDEMAATGQHGAEYVQFRRGDPVSFADVRPLLDPGGRQ